MWEATKSYLDGSLSRGEAVVLIVIALGYWRNVVKAFDLLPAALEAHKEECRELVEEKIAESR